MGASKVILKDLPEWAKEVPYQVKNIAVEDAYKAFSNGCRKWKAKGEKFCLSFRSKRNNKQSCFIPSSALKETGIYHTISGKLKMVEKLPTDYRDSRLICEHGRWFLMVPYKVATSLPDNQGQRVVALDPGIRTFLTGHGQEEVFKIGEADFMRIARLGRYMDKLISKISKSSSGKKYRMKKALSRMKFKIWDLIDELHYKSIRFLLGNYDLILLPTFNTSEMVAKSSRRIRSKTVRAMMSFSFYKFSTRLETKAKERGKAVLRVNEAYTSKTASWTGEVKNIGGSKTITSNGIKLDRDINGARGILIKSARELFPALCEIAPVAENRNCIG